MGKYWLIVKLVWIEKMAYRANFCLEILSGIVSSVIVVFLWLAVYRNASTTSIGGYSVADMVTYLIVGGIINSFVLTSAENTETSQSIRDGSISGLLLKPISAYGLWMFRDMGNKSFLLLVGLVGYAGVLLLFREHLLMPASILHFLLFLCCLILAAVLHYLLFEALGLLAFWMENTAGINFTVRVIMEVLGGSIIPLSLFPEYLHRLFLLTPFPFLIYLPMRIYLGKIYHGEIVPLLLEEAVWIAGLAVLNLALWRKGIRGYVSMGD